MKLNEIKEIEEYFQTSLFEMSNFFPEDTGLSHGTIMWVRTEPGVLPHVKYRVKFVNRQKGSAVFALWGEEVQQVAGDWEVTGNDLIKIKTLIKLSHSNIVQHVDGEISSAQLGKRLEMQKLEVEEI